MKNLDEIPKLEYVQVYKNPTIGYVRIVTAEVNYESYDLLIEDSSGEFHEIPLEEFEENFVFAKWEKL